MSIVTTLFAKPLLQASFFVAINLLGSNWFLFKSLLERIRGCHFSRRCQIKSLKLSLSIYVDLNRLVNLSFEQVEPFQDHWDNGWWCMLKRGISRGKVSFAHVFFKGQKYEKKLPTCIIRICKGESEQAFAHTQNDPSENLNCHVSAGPNLIDTKNYPLKW